MSIKNDNIEQEKTDIFEEGKYRLDVEDSEKVSGIIDRVSQKIEDVLSNKIVKRGVYRILDKIDEGYMDTIRGIWAKTPDEVKWAVMYMPALFKGNPALLHLMPLHLMVKCGLLDYPEKSVKNSAEVEKKAIEYGIKYGKYIQPELAALQPLIAPIQKVIDLEEKFFADLRGHLQAKKGARQGSYKTLPAAKNQSGENDSLSVSA